MTVRASTMCSEGAAAARRPLLLALGLAVASYWAPGLAAVSAPVRATLRVNNRAAGTAGVVLTFDDGPHPQGTAAVLELLADKKARATFFLVGEQVARRPPLAAEISAQGHEIALHCHRHRNLLTLPPRAVADDLRRALAAISDATGQMPRLYRPPYGILTAAALAVASRLDLTPLLWSQDGRDWQRRATAESIAARVTRSVRAGDVLLLHDADYYSAPGSWRHTVAALPRILEELERRRLPAIPWAPRSGIADVGREAATRGRAGRPASDGTSFVSS